MPRPPDPENRVRSEVRENLTRRNADCEHCHGQGLVTIFHEKYTGEPYIRLKRPDGKAKAYALRVAVPCVCTLGYWMKCERDGEDATAQRIAGVDLQAVIEGRIPWSMNDPTLPKYDPSQTVEPGDFQRMIERIHQIAKRPKKLLREPAPAAPSWKSLPPVPNVPAAPVEVHEEEYEDSIPF